MEALVDIKFDELLKIVKSLPEIKLSQLKAEIEKEGKHDNNRDDFEALLLNGPTFSKKQLDDIAKTRKAINQWRIK
ncbi:MAG TPA: hypothetical protein DCO83_10760 [Mucilaginibacter sp.]|jgi:hypothetical protein|nr:hypothetical protein [Mucilaginibacter sp.]